MKDREKNTGHVDQRDLKEHRTLTKKLLIERKKPTGHFDLRDLKGQKGGRKKKRSTRSPVVDD